MDGISLNIWNMINVNDHVGGSSNAWRLVIIIIIMIKNLMIEKQGDLASQAIEVQLIAMAANGHNK